MFSFSEKGQNNFSIIIALVFLFMSFLACSNNNSTVNSNGVENSAENNGENSNDGQNVTPTSLANPTGALQPYINGVVNVGVCNLRSGPGTDFPVVDGAGKGSEIPIYGRNEEGTWLLTDEEAQTWVYSSLVDLPVEISSLPIVSLFTSEGQLAIVTPTSMVKDSDNQDFEWLPLSGNIAKGVKVYYGELKAYAFKILGGSENCKFIESGRGLYVEYPDGKKEWKDRDYLIFSEYIFVRSDDPAIKNLEWETIPGC